MRLNKPFDVVPDRKVFDLPRPRKVALSACWQAVKADGCVPQEGSDSLDGFRFSFQSPGPGDLAGTLHHFSLTAQERGDGSTRITVHREGSGMSRFGRPDAGAGLPLLGLEAQVRRELERRAPTRSLFVSYRRDDSAYVTDRILDSLRARFGSDAMFRDVDDIPTGVDFRQAVTDALSQAKVLMAIIGPDWSGSTENRLLDTNDMVRFELETARASGMPILPVLVAGAASPPPAERLPASLAFLANINGAKVRPGTDFDRDMQDLNKSLSSQLEVQS